VNAENAALNAKTAALRAEIEPRDLSDAEMRGITGALSPFRGHRVLIQSYMGDGEGHRLMLVLAQVIGQAGLKVDPGYWYPDTSSEMKWLLGIEVSAPMPDADLATALQNALAATHLGARDRWFPVATEKEATIHIGVKPMRIPTIPFGTESLRSPD
jgi:hypothetical protein